MTADEWIASFAVELGVEPPSSETISTLLEIAASAAHGSERIAAPIACYLVAVAGADPAAALTAARAIEQPLP
jgi:Domain of unknown function (DUF6457)